MSATLTPSPRFPAQARQSSFYVQLREQLLDSLVRAGQSGDRVPSERQLAKQFDTSAMTISRILLEFQENGLLQRVPGKGTFICDPAVSKEGGGGAGIDGDIQLESTHLGGFIPRASSLAFQGQAIPGRGVTRQLRHTCIVANLSPGPEFRAREYWTHRLVSTVERRLQRQGVKTTLVDRKRMETGGAAATLDRLVSEGIDSLLYQGEGGMWSEVTKRGFDWNREMLRLRSNSEDRLTIAQIDLSGRNQAPFDSVSFDGVRGSFVATQHLLDLGHRDLCFLARSLEFPWIQERIEGFWQALGLAGVPTEEESFTVNGGGRVYCSAKPPEGVEEWTWAARDVVHRFFEDGQAHRRYTAVVAVNDEVASAFVEEAGRRGYRIPEDFSIIGFDDRLESKGIGLTTIHLPIEEIGEAAVSLLFQRHTEPFESGKINMVLNPTLVARSTCLRKPRHTN